MVEAKALNGINIQFYIFAGFWTIYVIARKVAGHAISNAFNRSVSLIKKLNSTSKEVKGKSFRGSRKNSRDKWYGLISKDFQNWWHRIGKNV